MRELYVQVADEAAADAVVGATVAGALWGVTLLPGQRAAKVTYAGIWYAAVRVQHSDGDAVRNACPVGSYIVYGCLSVDKSALDHLTAVVVAARTLMDQ